MGLWHRFPTMAYLAVPLGVLGYGSSEFAAVVTGVKGPELSVWRFLLGSCHTLFMSRIGNRPRLGVALGSGAARGWAHIGVLNALEAMGLRPAIIAGSSVGAIVGAIYALGGLPEFERWVCRLGRREILRYLDLNVGGGGFVGGERLRERFRQSFGDVRFDQLHYQVGMVATELRTGRERWLREGAVVDAIRASIALPGLFSPALSDDGEWLVDGGLVNPVPVSLCHAMGADAVIAVNLNGDLVGRRLRAAAVEPDRPGPVDDPGWLDRVTTQVRDRTNDLLAPLWGGPGPPERPTPPGLFEVMTTTINIMQDRITRSRMAGDPPDLMINPRLGRIGLLEFDRGREAIEEGSGAVRRLQPAIEEFVTLAGFARHQARPDEENGR